MTLNDEKKEPPSFGPPSGPWALKAIDLSTDSAICVNFRVDSFISSFGHADDFWGADRQGDRRYLEWLETKLADLPGSCCHLWHNSSIVGQYEYGLSEDDDGEAHLHLLYITSHMRSRRLGRRLLACAERSMVAHGFRRARLRVSTSNEAAIRFYQGNGWIKRYSDGRAPHLLIMHKSF